jgi:hypothetical protein
MDESSKKIPLNDDDCIEFNNNIAIRLVKFKAAMGDLNEMIQNNFSSHNFKVCEKKYINNHYIYPLNFLEDGVPCEVLKVNSQGWQKGILKIKVSVEFYPDEFIEEPRQEPESPLEEIRQMMRENQENSH